MSDYISREAAIEILRPYKIDPFKIGFLDDNIDGFNDGIETAISCIGNEVPAADVRPVVQGRWDIYDWIGSFAENGDFDVRSWKCSACNRISILHSKFCPNCGADMREEGSDG